MPKYKVLIFLVIHKIKAQNTECMLILQTKYLKICNKCVKKSVSEIYLVLNHMLIHKNSEFTLCHYKVTETGS